MQIAMKLFEVTGEFIEVDMSTYTYEDKVHILWMMRRLWNRQASGGDLNLTVQHAISLCKSILATTRPYSSLAKHTEEYLNDVISYGCKSHKERALKKKANK